MTGILFIRHLFANVLHKRSNLSTGKSTEDKILSIWDAMGVGIKNGEVGLKMSGNLLRDMETVAGNSSLGP